MVYTDTHTTKYCSIINNPSTRHNMDEPEGHYVNGNKTVKDKYYMLSLICELLKKKKGNLTDTEREEW